MIFRFAALTLLAHDPSQNNRCKARMRRLSVSFSVIHSCCFQGGQNAPLPNFFRGTAPHPALPTGGEGVERLTQPCSDCPGALPMSKRSYFSAVVATYVFCVQYDACEHEMLSFAAILRWLIQKAAYDKKYQLQHQGFYRPSSGSQWETASRAPKEWAQQVVI